MENLKQASGEILAQKRPPNFLSQPLLCSFSLQLIIFFWTAVLGKLFDVRFSYKHCNFSHVCLLVKIQDGVKNRDKVHSCHGYHSTVWTQKPSKCAKLFNGLRKTTSKNVTELKQKEFISIFWKFRKSSFKRRSAKSTSHVTFHARCDSRRTIQHFNKQLESIS